MTIYKKNDSIFDSLESLLLYHIVPLPSTIYFGNTLYLNIGCAQYLRPFILIYYPKWSSTNGNYCCCYFLISPFTATLCTKITCYFAELHVMCKQFDAPRFAINRVESFKCYFMSNILQRLKAMLIYNSMNQHRCNSVSGLHYRIHLQ